MDGRCDSEATRVLLDRLDAGEAEALGPLLNRHRGAIREAVARRLGVGPRARVDPSDIVQDAQLEAADRLPDYLRRRPMPFLDWLRRTALQRLNKHRRMAAAARRDPARERSMGSEPADDGPSPLQQLVEEDASRHVNCLIDRLSADDAEVLRLRVHRGLPFDRVADVLGIEPAAARKRFGRALLRLRSLLIAEGFSGSSS